MSLRRVPNIVREVSLTRFMYREVALRLSKTLVLVLDTILASSYHSNWQAFRYSRNFGMASFHFVKTLSLPKCLGRSTVMWQAC